MNCIYPNQKGDMDILRKFANRGAAVGAPQSNDLSNLELFISDVEVQGDGTVASLAAQKITVRINKGDHTVKIKIIAGKVICTKKSPELRHIRHVVSRS